MTMKNLYLIKYIFCFLVLLMPSLKASEYVLVPDSYLDVQTGQLVKGNIYIKDKKIIAISNEKKHGYVFLYLFYIFWNCSGCFAGFFGTFSGLFEKYSFAFS